MLFRSLEQTFPSRGTPGIVWLADTGTSSIGVYMFDPKTEKWRSYPTSAAHKRLTVDATGKIWVCQTFANGLTMIDPDSGKVTEYKLPLRYGNPQDVAADLENNLWMDVAVYNALVKFNPKTGEFMYVPSPILGAATRKIEADSRGTIWFGLGSPSQLTAFKEHGNRPARRAAS